LAAAALLVPWPRLAADVFLEAKLVVNLLPGVNQTDAQINALADRLNRILAQCPANTAFTLAGNDINRLAAFPAGFDRNGNTLLVESITRAERRRAANPEIAGGGYKIYVAALLTNNGVRRNGNTVVSQPISLIREQAGLGGDGQTWAHEVVHGLGRLGHSGDVADLMFQARVDRNGVAAGTNITRAECAIVLKGFLRLAPVVETTVEQAGFRPGDASAYVAVTDAVPVDLATGEPVADRPHLEVHAVRFYFDRGTDVQEVEIRLELSGPLPRDREAAAAYAILIDADRDDATGDAVSGIAGVDAVVHVGFEGSYPFGRRGRSFAVVSGPAAGAAAVELEAPPEIEAVRQFSDELESMPSDNVVVRVPLALLGELADPIEVGWTAREGGVAQLAPPQPVPTRRVSPSLAPGAFEARAGEAIAISGSGFAPGSRVDFFWDNRFDAPIASFDADDGGGFDARLTVPDAPAGDYYLDAIDAEGRVDIAVVTVLEAARRPAIGRGGLALFALGLLAGLLAVGVAAVAGRRRRARGARG
jgi:hypothetical protein